MMGKGLALGAMLILLALSAELVVYIVKQHIEHRTRMELFEMELERGHNVVVLFNKKYFVDCKNESLVLTDMYRSSIRYLYSTEEPDAVERERKVHALYNKYVNRLDKKCRKKTGRSIYEGYVNTCDDYSGNCKEKN